MSGPSSASCRETGLLVLDLMLLFQGWDKLDHRSVEPDPFSWCTLLEGV